ncbi:MAG: type II toxin-antitoxin system HipA family toxin [Polyangiaceae bacterium]
MPPDRCTLEIYVADAWRVAGTVSVEEPERGISSPGAFEYDFDYLDTVADALGARDARAVSCRYPVAYGAPEEPAWPPFLLDIMPAGAARRHWEGILELPNNASSDWSVLVRGAGNPPGNVRVREAVDRTDIPAHPGFARSDVLERRERFVEYARANGAPVSGSTGAGGDSPKFLLREDLKGRWHADGALPDSRARRCWLVKFPRTREKSDRLILEAEAGYHTVAKKMGVRTGGDVTWESDCLFMPRFDRVVRKGSVGRLGLESLYSLAGVADFGTPLRKERQVDAVVRYATEPEKEVRELLLRDVLDVAMGNTDNHARNTSVLKWPDGRVELSPVYDFAPMFLDQRMIARVSRWDGDRDFPEWGRVADALEKTLDPGKTRRWLRELADAVGELPVTMKACGVPRVVTTRCEERIQRVARELASVRA